MHSEIVSAKQGKCGICGMDLVLKKTYESKIIQNGLSLYKPIIIIISLILLSTLAITITFRLDTRNTMMNFMAGFFLVFSGFKLLDLPGFAQGYTGYDLLARKWKGYGYVYPFIELILGIVYIIRQEPLILINLVTFLVMSFSGLGVLESLAHKRKFQCACLGTIIKVPLTNVTLIEDFGMAAMALFMLLIP